MEKVTKKVIVSVDGSKDALKSLSYIHFMFGSEHDLNVVLFYVLPSMPAIFTDEDRRDKQVLSSLMIAEKKSINMADRILREAKKVLAKKGFDENRIQTVYSKRESGVARDTCTIAQEKLVDSVVITKQAQMDLADFFRGELSNQLLDYCLASPVWIVGGDVRSKKVLVCVDPSENALRAVDHAGFMLSGTDCQVTLFHAMRHLTRFVPDEVADEVPELETLWKKKETQEIVPYMEKARKILLDAGIQEGQITSTIAEGTRSPAKDILKEARERAYGTIVLGKKGRSKLKEFMFGSITNKVLNNASGLVCWVVQ